MHLLNAISDPQSFITNKNICVPAIKKGFEIKYHLIINVYHEKFICQFVINIGYAIKEYLLI
jgi:hypothetical protein